jgi:hypothetical protein
MALETHSVIEACYKLEQAYSLIQKASFHYCPWKQQDISAVVVAAWFKPQVFSKKSHLEKEVVNSVAGWIYCFFISQCPNLQISKTWLPKMPYVDLNNAVQHLQTRSQHLIQNFTNHISLVWQTLNDLSHIKPTENRNELSRWHLCSKKGIANILLLWSCTTST